MRLPLALAACVLIAGCGGGDKSDAENKRDAAGKTYCEALQKAGGLLEPMSQCLKEYEQATREPG
jgi:hypothetical protein